MLESKQSQMQQFFTNQDQKNSSCSGPFGPVIELIQILLDIKFNILPKFSADWSIYADDRM